MSATDVDAALADVAEVLDSDGFVASWDDTAEGIVFRVEAGGTECADCLVPATVLKLMVGSALEPTGRQLARLEMPDTAKPSTNDAST